MARITVEDCLEVVDNRFELVLMASKRARQLSKGAEPVVGADKNDKPTVLALREIAGGRINMDMVDEIDRQEKARAEREALEWAAAELDEDKGGDDISSHPALGRLPNDPLSVPAPRLLSLRPGHGRAPQCRDACGQRDPRQRPRAGKKPQALPQARQG